MFIDGRDLLGASLAQRAAISAFEQAHWAKQPWLKSVAGKTSAQIRDEACEIGDEPRGDHR
jgi:hypothetical protein